ncbi:hypothetical protein TNIN_458131 [Trichonephila inaurata madagascariensis]|uniref:Uncharacterized protein n=1 Tax=Trichonephila inaurata madagascariensis TaxID=2747483 RepID=A0A8X6XQY7_9ARAC|nr:hypothetical protein TNIN_458131 [Trichonephila inaurata madagascariensis]
MNPGRTRGRQPPIREMEMPTETRRDPFNPLLTSTEGPDENRLRWVTDPGFRATPSHPTNLGKPPPAPLLQPPIASPPRWTCRPSRQPRCPQQPLS